VVDIVVIQSNFDFNILGVLDQGVKIDFAGHHYNSAAATAQPVIGLLLNRLQLSLYNLKS